MAIGQRTTSKKGKPSDRRGIGGFIRYQSNLGMKFARWRVIKAAPQSSAIVPDKFKKALSRYQRLGESVVDRKNDKNDSRAKAQIALILLSASIRRDVSEFNPHFSAYRLEDLNDAFDYAWNMRLDSNIIQAIQQLIDA